MERTLSLHPSLPPCLPFPFPPLLLYSLHLPQLVFHLSSQPFLFTPSLLPLYPLRFSFLAIHFATFFFICTLPFPCHSSSLFCFLPLHLHAFHITSVPLLPYICLPLHSHPESLHNALPPLLSSPLPSSSASSLFLSTLSTPILPSTFLLLLHSQTQTKISFQLSGQPTGWLAGWPTGWLVGCVLTSLLPVSV